MAPADGKQTSFKRRRASLGVPEEAKTRSGCKGMTDCTAGWRDVARSATQEPRKASVKTANEPFTLQTQDRSAWNMGRDHQGSGVTVSGTTAAEGANVLQGLEDLSVVAFMSNRPPRSLNEVAQAITHTGHLNQLSHGNSNMNSRESRTAESCPTHQHVHQQSLRSVNRRRFSERRANSSSNRARLLVSEE